MMHAKRNRDDFDPARASWDEIRERHRDMERTLNLPDELSIDALIAHSAQIRERHHAAGSDLSELRAEMRQENDRLSLLFINILAEHTPHLSDDDVRYYMLVFGSVITLLFGLIADSDADEEHSGGERATLHADEYDEEIGEGAPPIDERAISEGMHEFISAKLFGLSSMSLSNLYKHVRILGGTADDVEQVRTILADPETDPSRALKYLIRTLYARKEHRNTPFGDFIARMQPTARAIAACENHVVITMPNEYYNSRMFQRIVEQCFNESDEETDDDALENADEQPMLDPIAALVSLVEIHDHINAICTRRRAKNILRDAAHHALDWLALSNVHLMVDLGPSEHVAALVVAAAHRISKTVTPRLALGCSEKAIRKHVDPALSDDDYPHILNLIIETTLCACADPPMFYADLADIPENIDERLKEIAPCLALRSPVNIDDLPVPSPYF